MLIDASVSTGNISPACQLNRQDTPASMTTNGSQVSLTLGGILGTTLSGAPDGSTLTLEIPSTSTGTIQTGTLQQATSDDFNRAVAALNGSISKANAQAATQQQAQQQASANAQAEQTAQGDLSALQGAADFTSELGSMSSDVGSTWARFRMTCRPRRMMRPRAPGATVTASARRLTTT